MISSLQKDMDLQMCLNNIQYADKRICHLQTLLNDIEEINERVEFFTGNRPITTTTIEEVKKVAQDYTDLIASIRKQMITINTAPDQSV